jgi:hypothetical protein
MTTERRKCGAKTRTDGRPCGRWAMKFQTRCDLHGGKAPNSVRAAERREALAVVQKAIQGEVIGVGANPVRVLQDLLTEAVAYKDYFAERLATLRALRYSSAAGFEQIRGEWQFYSASFATAGKLATTLAGLGLEELEKRIELARAQEVFDSYIAALKAVPSITPEQDAALRVAYAYQLRLRIPAGEIGTLKVGK